jgi:hypothetical protein
MSEKLEVGDLVVTDKKKTFLRNFSLNDLGKVNKRPAYEDFDKLTLGEPFIILSINDDIATCLRTDQKIFRYRLSYIRKFNG